MAGHVGYGTVSHTELGIFSVRGDFFRVEQALGFPSLSFLLVPQDKKAELSFARGTKRTEEEQEIPRNRDCACACVWG